jgi:hypothetical protein
MEIESIRTKNGKRSEQMEIDQNKWNLVRTNGNRAEQMEISPNKWKSVRTKWKSIRTNGNRSKQLEIGPNKWKSIRTNGNRSEQMEIGPNKWKSGSEHMEIGPNKWKSIQTTGNRSEQMEIGPNKWKSVRIKRDNKLGELSTKKAKRSVREHQHHTPLTLNSLFTMTSLVPRLLPHHRYMIPTHITPSITPFVTSLLCSSACSHSSVVNPNGCYSYHTSPPLHRPGYKPERNPKIKISLEQLRMAARTQGRRLPICHEQQEKVMNSLEAAKYEVCVMHIVDTLTGMCVIV